MHPSEMRSISSRMVCALMAVTGVQLVPPVGESHGCTCLIERDASRQRKRQIDDADLVFEGRVIRQRSLRAASWRCDFDVDTHKSPDDGCLRTRTLGDTCEPWTGIKVVLRDGRGRELHIAYTGQSGVAEFCGLTPGKYRIDASAPKLRPAGRDVEFDRHGLEVLLSLANEHQQEFQATFTVARLIKGPRLDQVTVRSWENDGSCGFGGFEAGKSYQVFAQSGTRWPPSRVGSFTGLAPRYTKGTYVVDLCGGTKPIDNGAVDAGR
jgi:hypothetical protein